MKRLAVATSAVFLGLTLASLALAVTVAGAVVYGLVLVVRHVQPVEPRRPKPVDEDELIVRRRQVVDWLPASIRDDFRTIA